MRTVKLKVIITNKTVMAINKRRLQLKYTTHSKGENKELNQSINILKADIHDLIMLFHKFIK